MTTRIIIAVAMCATPTLASAQEPVILKHEGWVAAEWGTSETGRRVRFYNVAGLVNELLKAQQDYRLSRLMSQISKQELIDRIHLYYDEINAEPIIFRWAYKMDEISIV